MAYLAVLENRRIHLERGEDGWVVPDVAGLAAGDPPEHKLANYRFLASRRRRTCFPAPVVIGGSRDRVRIFGMTDAEGGLQMGWIQQGGQGRWIRYPPDHPEGYIIFPLNGLMSCAVSQNLLRLLALSFTQPLLPMSSAKYHARSLTELIALRASKSP